MELGVDSTVFVEDVAITADLGVDCFGRSGKPQPVLVSAYLAFDFSAASKDDDFTKALDYRGINKAIKGFEGWKPGHVEDDEPRGIDSLNTQVFEALCDVAPIEASEIRVRCHAPKAIMHCDGGLTMDVTRTRMMRQGIELRLTESHIYSVDKLRVVCIIGIGKEERVIKQPVLISFQITDLDFFGPGVKTLADGIHELVSKTAYQTIEALIEHVYKFMIDFCQAGAEEERPSPSAGYKIQLKISKPAVFSGAAGPGVQIVRTIKAIADKSRASSTLKRDNDLSDSDAKPRTKKRETR